MIEQTASLELLAAALCHDAQVEGYDHGASPTLVSFAPAYCPRHLGIAQSVRFALSRNFLDATAYDELRATLDEWDAGLAELTESPLPGARYAWEVMKRRRDALAR